ncbi:hypothetical protein Q31b_48300 [Novipirellula aureliae]|uniref:Uncharacterized protein n=1 Tax=Novipirellula aureliae TaxID=2527966 RepID=A0A5C6DNW3_9BACT|nr:hypothetical protein Q31b_48300 [Novipirellula aureliae]
MSPRFSQEEVQTRRTGFQSERLSPESSLTRMIHGLANCFANVYALKRLRSLLEKQSAY